MKIPLFVINLKKDVERKKYMIDQFRKFNILNYIFFDAVEGSRYKEYKFNIEIMKNWSDPTFKRNINYGEIGCFLSHYLIWSKVVSDNIKAAIILEDDNTLHDNFMVSMQYVLEIDFHLYDIFYLSRYKFYPNAVEINITNDIVIPSYCYNANAYIITNAGAKKLLNTNILKNLIPVDEYLPIMYNCEYPNTSYSNVFANYDKLTALALFEDITTQLPRNECQSNIFDSSEITC